MRFVNPEKDSFEIIFSRRGRLALLLIFVIPFLCGLRWIVSEVQISGLVFSVLIASLIWVYFDTRRTQGRSLLDVQLCGVCLAFFLLSPRSKEVVHS